MSRLRSSTFFADLYRDLRDRRLLIPIAALAVAILAVPFLLGGSETEVVPPPVVPPLDAGARAATPAVLAETGGIRDYRKRLEALKEKNPFAQKFQLPTPESVALGETTAADSSATGGDLGATDTTSTAPLDLGTSVDTATDSAPVDTAVTPATDTGDGADGSPSDDSSSKDARREPKTRFYADRIDVKIGKLGELKTFENVRRLELLPNDRAPVVAYVGLAEDAEHAIFTVSRDVSATDGEGSCAPKKPEPCQFLKLAVGDERTFTYSAAGDVYRMKLLDTRIVRVPDPRSD